MEEYVSVFRINDKKTESKINPIIAPANPINCIYTSILSLKFGDIENKKLKAKN